MGAAAAAAPLCCAYGAGLAAKLRRFRLRWLPFALLAAATESTVKMSRHRGGGGGGPTFPLELALPLTLYAPPCPKASRVFGPKAPFPLDKLFEECKPSVGWVKW